MVDIQSAAAEIRRGKKERKKKEERRKKKKDRNQLHRAAAINSWISTSVNITPMMMMQTVGFNW